MPYTLTLRDGVLLVELAGVVTGEELLRLDEEIQRARGPGGALPNRVTDMSATTRSPLGFAEVFTLVQGRRERAAASPARLALVAPTPVQKGFARMFQTMSDPPRTTVRIFDDLPSALAWAKGDEADSA